MSESLIQRHPLQKLSSPSRGVSAVLHLIGLSNFLWSFKYMYENPNQANEGYGWHWQYLTVIGLTLSTLTFFVALLADITLSRRLFLIKNLLSVCSAPMEVLISVLYWGLRSIDKRLVLPDWLVIPFFADFSFHAFPAIMMFIDLLFLSPPWTITVMPALGISGAIAFGYWYWVERCFQHNGWYPYPIFELLPTHGRVALFSFSAIVMALSTITLKLLYGRVNGFGITVPPHMQSRSGNIKRKEGL